MPPRPHLPREVKKIHAGLVLKVHKQPSYMDLLPVELVIRIMKLARIKDVLSLIDTYPQMKSIFNKADLALFLYRRDALSKRRDWVPSDIVGYLRSHVVAYFLKPGDNEGQDSDFFHLPAGRYTIGMLYSTLNLNVYRDLWFGKAWADNVITGLLEVVRHKRRSGVFAVLHIHARRVHDSRGTCHYKGAFGIVPLSLCRIPNSKHHTWIDSKSVIYGVRTTDRIVLRWTGLDDKAVSLEVPRRNCVCHRCQI